MTDHNGSISEVQNEHPAWKRCLDIVLRAAHVLVISVLFGGAVFKIPADQLLPFQILSIITGGALIASEVNHRRHWPTQGRGLMVYIHGGLFGLASFQPKLSIACLLVALVIGIAGSHMPKKYRFWEFIHRQGKDGWEGEEV
jgi:hypothetical protein